MKVDELRETLKSLAEVRNLDKQRERVFPGFFPLTACLTDIVLAIHLTPPMVWWEQYLKHCEERDARLCATCTSLRSAIRACVVSERDEQKKQKADKRKELLKKLKTHRYPVFFWPYLFIGLPIVSQKKFPS